MTVEERRAYQKEYRANNKAKIAAHNKKYRANNKAKLVAKNKEYWTNNKDRFTDKNKEYAKEYSANNKDRIATKNKKYDQTPKGKKSRKIRDWKSKGVIGNLSKIYDEIYLPSTHCDICKTEYKSTFDRCLDHCHLSGEFRQMLCRACNVFDRWEKKVIQSEEED